MNSVSVIHFFAALKDLILFPNCLSSRYVCCCVLDNVVDCVVVDSSCVLQPPEQKLSMFM